MNEQTVEYDARRAEIAEVVYRELGDMVNRDYLIDALVPVIAAREAMALNEGVRLAAQLVQGHMLDARAARAVHDFLIRRADRVMPPGSQGDS